MKLKTLLLLTIFLFIKERSNAQLGMGKVEDIKELQSRTLVVVLRKESPKMLKKLSEKPDELKAYQKSIANYNEGFKLAMQNFWPYKQNIKYIELSSDTWTFKVKPEIEEMLEGKDKSHYAFILQKIDDPTFQNGEFRDYSGLKLSSLIVALGEKDNVVGEIKLPFSKPSEADFIYGIQQLKNYFD